MLTIGVDAHKRVHVAIAVDEQGREVGAWRGLNSLAGWRDFGHGQAAPARNARLGSKAPGAMGVA